MTAEQSRVLNALGLIAVSTVLILAFVDQVWFRDLPCPLCVLQRVGFIAAGFGLALNLIFGIRASHYGVVILGAIAGAIVAGRQVLLHIVPGTGSYGNPIFGLHLYTWALIAFLLMVVCAGFMLLFDRQFASTPAPPRKDILSMMALVVFGAIVIANMVSTLLLCGLGLCPENPGGYLIFNDNLRVTSG